MKITEAEVIKNGEQELIDAITADLDWGAIEGIFQEEHGLGFDEEVEYKKGDMVVHEGNIVYQLDFEVKVTISVLLDRNGNYISVAPSKGAQEDKKEDAQEIPGDQDPLPSDDEEVDRPLSAETDSAEVDDDNPPSLPDEASPEERISRMASRAGEIMEAL